MKKPYFSRRAILCLLAFFLTLMFALTGQYVSSGYKIEVGKVSKATIKASRDVENTVKTEREKQEIIENTEPRYTIDKTINQSVTDSLDDFFIIADDERARYKEFKTAQATTPTNETFKSDKLATFLPDDASVKAVLTASDEDYNALKTGTKEIVNETLQTGVKESDLEKNKAYVDEKLGALTSNESLNNVAISIYDTFFRANLVVDEAATNAAIEEQLALIEPEIYLKGQTIVNDGDIVTEEQYQMLKDLGYVDTKLSEKKGTIAGIIILISSCFAISIYYLTKFCAQKKFLRKNEETMLFCIYAVTLVTLWATSGLPIYCSPILVSIILISVFFGDSFGIFYSLMIITAGSLIVGYGIQYILFLILTGTFATIIAKGILSRKNVYKIAVIYGTFNTVCAAGLLALFTNNSRIETFLPVVYIFIQGAVTIIISFGLLPIIENAFSVITPNKLLELSNPDNELLKRATIEMPGTYHHSLVVANLSETAARSIGADATLARVCAYYHDIGKLVSPMHFSENQVGENIHDRMLPSKSFEIIASHTTHGVELGKKHKLPREIIEMMPEHHGTTLVKFFYIKAKNLDESVTEEAFRYSGPKPQSKEAGILMLADTCEAAIRAKITKVTDFEEVRDFVDVLVQGKIEDGQLTESELTYGDVENIKEAFISVFKGMYHQRIEYPKLIEEEKKETEQLEEQEKEQELVVEDTKDEVSNDDTNK